MTQIQIPEFLAHLPIDKRWKLPIPFITGDVLGTQSHWKGLRCALGNLCTVCGERLGRLSAVLCRPSELPDHVLGEGPMHESCARAAFTLCPHLARISPIDCYDDDIEPWVMLRLYASEWYFQTAESARVTGPVGKSGLHEPDELAKVWSRPDTVDWNCSDLKVRWRIRPRRRFPQDRFTFFDYDDDRTIREVPLEYVEYDHDHHLRAVMEPVTKRPAESPAGHTKEKEDHDRIE